jgi:hypothetical protein
MAGIGANNARVISELRESMMTEIRRAVNESLTELVNGKSHELKTMGLKADKVLFDSFSREIESSVSIAADELTQRLERVLSAKLDAIRGATSRASGHNAAVNEKLRILQAKITQLESAASSMDSGSRSSAAANPYAEIEQRAAALDWDGAWHRAVEVYNGVDFMLHLMGSSTPEEFFSANPVHDPLLALQITINAARELLQSDKSLGVKLEIISELILGLTNPNRMSLSHQFAQLRDLTHQLSTKIQSSRLKEIQKIILATERLITPPVSIESTPLPPVHRYSAGSPAPMYP